jgi:VWFA-related protein
MPYRRLAASAAVLVAALFAAAPHAAAQPETGPDVFGEVIDVRVVNVEVVVTDRDGNRVLGLGPEDFRLTVDGEQVPISYFSEVVGGQARPVAGEGPQAAPQATDGGRVGISYLVFVDDATPVARDRDKVLEQIADSLDFLRPGDRMAVVAFDGRRVEMLTTWTDSPAELRRAFSDARARPARGLLRYGERRHHDSVMSLDADFAPATGSLDELKPQEREFARKIAHDVERGVAGAVAALRGFAQPPGRKVMLLLAGDWPFDPAAYAAGLRQVLPTPDIPRGPELLRPLVDTANLLGYTLYPVDVPGLGMIDGTGIEQLGRQVGTSPISGSLNREDSMEDTLGYLAHATGGRALINAQRLQPVEQVAGDTGSYYWLGFSPDRQGDDRRHRIEVSVTRPRLSARSRTSFLDLSPQAERQMAVESSLLFGDPATEGTLVVDVGEPRAAGRRLVEVPLRIAIPVDGVNPLPAPNGDWVLHLEMRLGALDDRDRDADVPVVPIELRFKEPPPAGKFIVYDTALKLRRVEQVLVVSMTDVASGNSMTARVEVNP